MVRGPQCHPDGHSLGGEWSPPKNLNKREVPEDTVRSGALLLWGKMGQNILENMYLFSRSLTELHLSLPPPPSARRIFNVRALIMFCLTLFYKDRHGAKLELSMETKHMAVLQHPHLTGRQLRAVATSHRKQQSFDPKPGLNQRSDCVGPWGPSSPRHQVLVSGDRLGQSKQRRRLDGHIPVTRAFPVSFQISPTATFLLWG